MYSYLENSLHDFISITGYRDYSPTREQHQGTFSSALLALWIWFYFYHPIRDLLIWNHPSLPIHHINYLYILFLFHHWHPMLFLSTSSPPNFASTTDTVISGVFSAYFSSTPADVLSGVFFSILLWSSHIIDLTSWLSHICNLHQFCLNDNTVTSFHRLLHRFIFYQPYWYDCLISLNLQFFSLMVINLYMPIQFDMSTDALLFQIIDYAGVYLTHFQLQILGGWKGLPIISSS